MVKIRKISLGEFPLILAPMEDITNHAFRILCKKYGADVLYSEFIASDALVRNIPKSLEKTIFDNHERPFGIQIFGNDPAVMAEAAMIVESFCPDFIDLNFGCPVKKVVAKGGGAALLNDIPKMLKITEAVVKAVQIPVTIKTRLGWDEKNKPIVELAEKLQDSGAAAIAIHARTKAQMYGGKSDWTLIGEVKKNQNMKIPVFGNGDIDSPEMAIEMKNKFGIDGLMIGRATIGNPFIFNQIKNFMNKGILIKEQPLKIRVEACKELLLNTIITHGERKGILLLRKHYTNFFKGINNFKPTRMKLVTSTSVNEIIDLLDEIEKKFNSSYLTE
ncbi:MAG: tRNA dihydrouridine synthase DusB [Bacteroidales bacterium]|nr:tRNA dihydrouridine synthase DusB [Bacteroidales bacterium]